MKAIALTLLLALSAYAQAPRFDWAAVDAAPGKFCQLCDRKRNPDGTCPSDLSLLPPSNSAYSIVHRPIDWVAVDEGLDRTAKTDAPLAECQTEKEELWVRLMEAHNKHTSHVRILQLMDAAQRRRQHETFLVAIIGAAVFAGVGGFAIGYAAR